MEKEQVEQAYNKIDNLCCMNSNNQGFFDAYKETKDNDFCKDAYDMVDALETIKQALTELKSIKESKPSEAMDKLEGLGFGLWNEDKSIVSINGHYFKNAYDAIKAALLKAQEQDIVLEVIKEYQVDIWLLKQCDYKNYIRIRKEAMVSVGQIVNENGIILENEITEEEFELVKKWAEKIKQL